MTRLRLIAAAAFVLAIGLFVSEGSSRTTAHPVAPAMFSPAEGETVASLGPMLVWSNPLAATQYHLQIVPANSDGPGIDIYVARADLLFRVPAPPEWYGLLPDMTYTWRLQVSDSPFTAAPADPSWGLWAERTFRTPGATPTTMMPMMPGQDEPVTTLLPTVQWNDSNPEVFYYEVQLSKDPQFDTNPATATTSVYWMLLHGGVSEPRNSYRVPLSFLLESATKYYWRVRPRVQGDGEPVTWTPAFDFTILPGSSPILPTPTPTATTNRYCDSLWDSDPGSHRHANAGRDAPWRVPACVRVPPPGERRSLHHGWRWLEPENALE